MSQNDEPGAGRRADPGDATTQAFPTPSGATGRAGGTAFDRSPGRPLPQQGPGRGEAADRQGTDGASTAAPDRRPIVPRPSVRTEPRSSARPPARTRRAKLALRRIDPWSVFLFSLLASIFLGIVLVVAVSVLYAVLARLGVLESINDLFGEVAGDGTPNPADTELITADRVISGAAVLAAVDIVLLTALATLGALLYNLCAALTGGIEVTLGERD